MNRDSLFIPNQQLLLHFAKNIRQDVKIVAPGILSPETVQRWQEEGRTVKAEKSLQDTVWTHSPGPEPNKICESIDFDFASKEESKGPFTVSFANEKAEQKVHYHEHHAEIYFSEHQIGGYYRKASEPYEKNKAIDLPEGGAVIFAPNVVHFMELYGLTIVIEVPAVETDIVKLDR